MSNVNEVNHPPPYISMIINQKTDKNSLQCSPPSTLIQNLFSFRSYIKYIYIS